MSTIFYWGVYFIVILAQAFYTFSSMNQIRLEEVIESFRSVWWFQNHLVWNGSYSLVGWYTLLTLIYNVFGFHFYSGKFLKLGIEIISYFFLAKMLKKYLGEKIAWLPLLTIGLSPTFLYLNSLQVANGTEVSFFIICLYILYLIDFKKQKEAILKQSLLWGIAMFAWLTYFGFAFYLPLLFAYYLYLLLKPAKHINYFFVLKNLVLSFLIFLLPLLASLFYIENRELLIYDSSSQKGLFRSFAKVEAKPDVWLDTFQRVTKDLFIAPASYYFESKKVEFSDYYPIITLITVICASCIIFIRKKRLRIYILSLGLFLLLYLFLISTVGPKTLGGIRRGTVLLVLFYALFTIVWQFTLNQKKSFYHYLLLALLSLLLIHHLVVYPINVLHIKKPSIFRERWWFYSEYPDKTLLDMVSTITKTDVTIPCWRTQNQNNQCAGLSLIYPALSLACKHSHLKCNKLYSYDYDSKKKTLLNIDYWGQQAHLEP